MKIYKSNLKEARLISVKQEQTKFKNVKITSPHDANNIIRQFYHDDLTLYESFFVLLLNKANNTIAYAKISQGGVTGTVVDPIIVAKYAVDCLASAVILAHNHPSGNIKPSEPDIKITNKIKEALNLFDVKVLDHLIITENEYFSFANEGKL